MLGSAVGLGALPRGAMAALASEAAATAPALFVAVTTTLSLREPSTKNSTVEMSAVEMPETVAVQRSFPLSIWPFEIDDATVNEVAPAAPATSRRAISAGTVFRIRFMAPRLSRGRRPQQQDPRRASPRRFRRVKTLLVGEGGRLDVPAE